MMGWLASFCGAVALTAIALLQMARSSRSWPTVAGRVLTADEIKAAGIDPYPFAYEYFVNGTRYVSATIELFASHRTELEFIRNLAPGSKVSVYYNPKEPHRGMVTPGASRRLWVLLGSMVAVSTVGAGIALWQMVK